jgi:hypothetical protein
MSLARVNKNIHNLSLRLHGTGNLKKVPIILSDSKGERLEAVVDLINHPENKIYFWYRKGTGVNEQYLWLKENLQEKLRILGTNHITLYIWLGTCDLTVKSDKFIKIRSEDFSAVRSLCKGLKDIFSQVATKSNSAYNMMNGVRAAQSFPHNILRMKCLI